MAKKVTLEAARTDSFLDLMAWIVDGDRKGVKKAFKAQGIATYADFLEAVELVGRKLYAAGQPLDPSNGIASFEIMIRILSFDPAQLTGRLGERFIRNLHDLSGFVLGEGSIAFERSMGRTAVEAARPTAARTYEAVLVDIWPDSPAAIADFFLTDQKRYEALYYPIREAEITVEQLDRALGDAAALTRLVNAAPSNPHKGVVFGWESSMNGGFA